MALPPTTGVPLNLYTPAFDYGTNPGDDTWDIPINLNWVALNNFASTVVLLSPTASQTLTQPATTYFNMNAPMAFGTLPVLRFGVSANIWDTSLSRTAAGTLSVDDNTPGDGNGALIASTVNAKIGFEINGAAPSNHILVGNGTNYVDSATIPTGAANYQVVEQAGTPLTQRNKLNFLAPLTAVDNSGNGSTDVGASTSGATAGSYTNPNVTVDVYGRVTAIASGPNPFNRTPHNMTSSRVFGTTYQNTSGVEMLVSGWATQIGSGTGTMVAAVGPSSPTLQVWSDFWGATADGAPSGFSFTVPIGYFYSVSISGNIHPLTSGGFWFEYF